jgi:hypothetical protein
VSDRDWERPIDSAQAWGGVWFRNRAGPTTKGTTVHVERWHRVEAIDGDRINTVCRPSWRKPWPSGGLRMEIARPYPFHALKALPGDICSKCAASPMTAEVEVSSDLVEDIVERVMERMANLGTAEVKP